MSMHRVQVHAMSHYCKVIAFASSCKRDDFHLMPNSWMYMYKFMWDIKLGGGLSFC